MSVAHRGVPGTHPLVHHLETALAACDELLTRNTDIQSSRRLELTVITHILQARQRATEIAVEDRNLRRWLAVLASETDVLEVAAPDQPSAPRQAGELLIGGRIGISGLTVLLASLLDELDSRSMADEAPGEPGMTVPSALHSHEASIWATGADAV